MQKYSKSATQKAADLKSYHKPVVYCANQPTEAFNFSAFSANWRASSMYFNPSCGCLAST